MPTVPYNPVPSTSPDSAPVPYRTDRGVTETAFGANIGQAISGLGREVEKTADVMESRILAQQKMINESAAKDSVVKYATAEGDAITDMYSKEGADAREALPAFQERVAKLREDALSGLNPEARRMADQEIARRASFAVIDAGRHVAQQDKIYAKRNDEAMIGLAQKDVNNSPFNEAKWREATTAMDVNTRAALRREGYRDDDPVVQLRVQSERDKAWQTRLFSIGVGLRNPQAAKDMYEQHKDEIKDDNIRNNIEKMLTGQMVNYGTTARQTQITSGMPMTYAQATAQMESGGKPSATSGMKGQTAGGLYGFNDPTWKDLMKKYPNEGFTTGGQYDPAQANRALELFTADNKAYMASKGIEPTEANARMSHFLGRAGGPAFIQGMQQNPDQPAYQLATPQQVAANRNVFYNRDGTPRTAQEVFNSQTILFRGPDAPLNGRSGPEWLNNALQKASDIADHDAPGDGEYKLRLQQKVTNEYNRVTGLQTQQDNKNYQDTLNFINGNGVTANRVKSEDAFFANKQWAEMFEKLPDERKTDILAAIAQNAKTPTQATPEQHFLFREMVGLANRDPAKFKSLNVNTLNLTEGQRDQLSSKQNTMITQGVKADEHSDVNARLEDTMIKRMLQSVGYPPSRDDDAKNRKYNQLVGELDAALAEHKTNNNGKPMSNEDLRKTLGGLIAKSVDPNSGIFGFFQKEKMGFEVPESFKQEHMQEATRANGGVPPDEVGWGRAYYYYQQQQKRGLVSAP